MGQVGVSGSGGGPTAGKMKCREGRASMPMLTRNEVSRVLVWAAVSGNGRMAGRRAWDGFGARVEGARHVGGREVMSMS
jgi:hypothetical protein